MKNQSDIYLSKLESERKQLYVYAKSFDNQRYSNELKSDETLSMQDRYFEVQLIIACRQKALSQLIHLLKNLQEGGEKAEAIIERLFSGIPDDPEKLTNFLKDTLTSLRATPTPDTVQAILDIAQGKENLSYLLFALSAISTVGAIAGFMLCLTCASYPSLMLIGALVCLFGGATLVVLLLDFAHVNIHLARAIQYDTRAITDSTTSFNLTLNENSKESSDDAIMISVDRVCSSESMIKKIGLFNTQQFNLTREGTPLKDQTLLEDYIMSMRT